MQTNRIHHPLSRLTAGAIVVGSTALLLTGVLVAPAGAVTGTPYTTKVLVTSSPASLQTGQPAIFTAKVVSPLHSTPSGQVIFSIVGSDNSVQQCDSPPPAALVNGSASCLVSGGLFAASSPYNVQAAYTEIDNASTYKPSNGSRIQLVSPGKTVTGLSSSSSPSVTGQNISINAAVTAVAPAVGSPTGSVTFVGVTCDGGSNTIVLVSGMAQCSIPSGLVSQKSGYPITGNFTPDSTQFGASSGNFKQSVLPAATTVTLVPSGGSCTGDVCTIPQATPLSFVATAASSGSDSGTGTPAGTMAFAIMRPGSNGSLQCDGGTNAIPLDNTGHATCTISAGLPAIIYYKVTATLTSSNYLSSGASLFENSALWSTNLTESVPKGIGAGQSFDITVVVAPIAVYTGLNTPTGFVNILVCGANSNGSNGCQGGAVPVDSSGTATLTVGGGEFPGVYNYRAVYMGDSNFYSSAAKSRGFSVGLSSTSLALSEPGGFYSVDGAAVGITATVATPNGAAGSTLIGPPTGNVSFTVTGPGGQVVSCAGGNSIALSSGPEQVEGSVTCFLPAGSLTNSMPPTTSYTILVTYSGDSNYHASGGHAVQVVAPPAL